MENTFSLVELGEEKKVAKAKGSTPALPQTGG